MAVWMEGPTETRDIWEIPNPFDQAEKSRGLVRPGVTPVIGWTAWLVRPADERRRTPNLCERSSSRYPDRTEFALLGVPVLGPRSHSAALRLRPVGGRHHIHDHLSG